MDACRVATTRKCSKPADKPSINWRTTIYVVGAPLGALMSLLWVPVYGRTIWVAVIYGFIRGLVVTAGYHRLWAHRSYTASTPLKLLFAIIGAGAGQDHIKKWCRDHRAHHRYVDTDLDPYNISKGFFHAHIGWMIFEQSQRSQGFPLQGRVDMSDLETDPVVEWQRRYYYLLLFIAGYVIPTTFCGLFLNDFLGGFIVSGCIATAFVQQVTFCVNSFAHWAGPQPFSDTKSPRDNPLVALFTLGEGYHNFHHEFPVDYRAGARWYDFDPTKWFIWICSRIGLASNLKRYPRGLIEKGRLQQRHKMLQEELNEASWPLEPEELPIMGWEAFYQQSRTGRDLIVVGGFAHDVSGFVAEHPGGTSLITGAIGTDATKLFEGGVYNHSRAARNLLATMRVARVGDN